MDFNPRAPCGARREAVKMARELGKISIHAPRVGRDKVDLAPLGYSPKFQSTRPVWGATDSLVGWLYITTISIHAPRVGRDHWKSSYSLVLIVISIHAPRVGRDRRRQPRGFLQAHFNPRAPCGARPDCFVPARSPRAISIHAPRVGRDLGGFGNGIQYNGISIHAPRVGRDQPAPGARPHRRDFNPRAPCGARQQI